MLSITPLGNIETPRSSVLRARVKVGKCAVSIEFVARMDENEVGLLIYEDWREKSLGFIYEINVLAEYRGQNIGRQLLEFAEQYALSVGCASIGLQAYALDQATDQKRLRAWYVGVGYTPEAMGSDRLRKALVGM